MAVGAAFALGLAEFAQNVDTDIADGHLIQAGQEDRLLGSTRKAQTTPTSFGTRLALLASVAAAVALVAAAAAYFDFSRRGSAIRAARSRVLFEDRSVLNLDITLTNLPHWRLSADPTTKTNVENAVETIFQGKLPDCEVFAEVVPHKTDPVATTVQLTLLPLGSASTEDLAIFIESPQEMEMIQVLLRERIDDLPSIESIRSGEVGLISIEEATQDGLFQRTAAETLAGSSLVPMEDTTLQEGDRVAIVVPDHQGALEEELTVEAIVDGNLQVQPALSNAYPAGSLVILLGLPTPTPTAAPRPSPTPQPTTMDPSVPSPTSRAAAPSVATQIVVLKGLPSSSLGEPSASEVERKVGEACAKVLGKSTSQVSATVKRLEQRPRLRALADSAASQQTDLEVAVETSLGQSMCQLEEHMSAKAGQLARSAATAVESVPGIDDIATDKIKANLISMKAAGTSTREKLDLPFLSFPLFVCVIASCLVSAAAFCTCLACRKRGREAEPNMAREPGDMAEPKPEKEDMPKDQPPDEVAAAGLRAPDPVLSEEKLQADWEESLAVAEDGFHAPEPVESETKRAGLAKSPGSTEEAAEVIRRLHLISQVFRKFDADGDSLLNEQELGALARALCKFDGTDQQWGTEYQLICSDLGAAVARGVDLDHFVILVEDSGSGDKRDVNAMYCTTGALERAVVLELPSPSPVVEATVAA